MTDATLDPADWPAFRAFAHELLDAMIDRSSARRRGRSGGRSPSRQGADRRAPARNAHVLRRTLRRELEELVLPYAVGNTHPRFWGWVHGSGTPGGALAELVAARSTKIAAAATMAASISSAP